MFILSTPVVALSSNLTEDMAPTRGQNVSVLQLRETQPLELPSTTRGAAACNSIKTESEIYTDGENLNEHSLGNYLRGACGLGKSSSVCVLNSDNSSDNFRELSPVYWCDRDDDEVCLGRSGWVQVQHRSLDDTKGANLGQSNAASLRSRKFSSNFSSNVNSLERKEQNRPVNLPLSSRKREDLTNHKTPYAFTQKSVTAPPPSITPILSPPPAFRDEKTDIEFYGQRVEKAFYFEDSFHWKSPAVSDSEGSSARAPIIVESSGSTVPPVYTSRHHSRLGLQTKSLDEESLGRIPDNSLFVSAAPLTLFAFRSLDNGCRKSSSTKVSVSDSILKNFYTSEKKSKITNHEDSEDDEEDRENCSTVHSTAFRTSWRDRLTSQRVALITRRQRKCELNGKHIPIRNSVSASSRTRSPPLDSNSCNSSSSSSSGSSSGGRSQKMSSRRSAAKQFQPQSNYCTDKISKHFNVKRSRSLQLSQERPSQELMLMSHSSSGKSWDRVSADCVPVKAKNDNNRYHSQSFRNLHNVVVAVNGQGIPVISRDGQCLNLMKEITTSEKEQQKLIREAEKEARVISEYLNGTKSRAAARSLLMHRYFNRPETPTSEHNEGSDFRHTKPQSDSRVLSSPRPLKNSPTPSNDIHPYRSSHDTSRHPHTDLPKPSPIAPTRPSNTPTTPQSSFQRPSNNYTDNFSSTLFSQLTAPRLKRKHHYQQPSLLSPLFPGSENPNASTSLQRQPSNTTKNQYVRRFQSPPAGPTVTPFFQNVSNTPSSSDPPVASPRPHLPSDSFRQNSSTSTSSTDAPLHYVPKLSVNTHQISTASDLSLDSLCLHSDSFASDGDSHIPNFFYPRPASAPETNNYTSVPLHRRSLSLPRSFLSELCSKEYFARRNSFPRRKKQPQLHDIYTIECPGQTAPSATLPTTLVCHSRRNRKIKTPSYNKSPCTSSLVREPALVQPQWTGQRYSVAAGSCSDQNRQLRNWAFAYDADDDYNDGTHMGIQNDGHLRESSLRRIESCELDDRSGAKPLTIWDVQDQQPFRPLRGSKTHWEPFTHHSISFAGRSSKGQLKRSLSLNELPPEDIQSRSRPQSRALSEDENPFDENTDDELSSNSEPSERWPSSQISSDAQTTARQLRQVPYENQSTHSAQKKAVVVFADAVWDHVAFEPFELSFKAGDVIEVLDTSDRHWWWGAKGQSVGYLPSEFVRLRGSPSNTETPVPLEASTESRRSKSSALTSEQIRSNVVKELLNTERDFVKILRDVKDGYMAQCSRRPDLFTSAQISTIFGNLDDILVFQEEFLKDLEGRIDEEFPHRSCVGEAFLIHSSGFRMYSEYCNFHPMAMTAIQDLYRKDKYRKFFEMCRLKQNLSEIPLDGYLLTPIQRICKYPLQLSQLLKYTKPDHPDFAKVEKAFETMRSVTTLINERKRKMERLEKLAAWQCRVEGWEGDDLIELSSQLIYQGDVVRITSGMWTTNITLFLFDHQIIYCKKDLLKRHNYIYKGRICLDGSEVVDLADGKNQQLGITIRYGIKIYSDSKDTWLIFCCRSSEEKKKWLSALAEEKRVVAQDKELGLDLLPSAKQLAKMVATGANKINTVKPRGKNKIGSNQEVSVVRDGHLRSGKMKGSRRMGNWFTFGVIKSPKVSLRQRTSFQQIT